MESNKTGSASDDNFGMEDKNESGDSGNSAGEKSDDEIDGSKHSDGVGDADGDGEGDGDLAVEKAVEKAVVDGDGHESGVSSSESVISGNVPNRACCAGVR